MWIGVMDHRAHHIASGARSESAFGPCRRWAFNLLRYTHLLESSGDPRAAQELSGHADISSPQVYTHLDFRHPARAYDRGHPRAKKK
ncbi:MAG: tyrosine-type recombinase/integrase [Ectothiorhodospiraceae bacterium AqS1]|nr:tyrosine-type recombinase/integrase [Ectothiorhodospiraceae bacterium AqS1]